MPSSSTSPDERPLLTIAIPTYNRSELLVQLLDCLREEILTHPEVRLLVSDNASSDKTREIIEGECLRGMRIDYIRNRENIGADANFLQCYERATAKYVWIISDDDLLVAGAVTAILRYLAQDEYDVVFVEQRGFSGDLPKVASDALIAKPIVCSDAESFLKRVHIFTTLISCNIINKDRVDSVQHAPFSTLLNSNLIQLGWTFTALRNHRKSLYFPNRLVLYRLANTGGYGVCRVFGRNLAEVTRQWLGIPRLSNIVLNASLQRLLPRFVLASQSEAQGDYSPEDPHALLSPLFRSKLRYWVFIYPLVALPHWFARGWIQIIRIFNRIDRALGYPSLGV